MDVKSLLRWRTGSLIVLLTGLVVGAMGGVALGLFVCSANARWMSPEERQLEREEMVMDMGLGYWLPEGDTPSPTYWELAGHVLAYVENVGEDELYGVRLGASGDGRMAGRLAPGEGRLLGITPKADGRVYVCYDKDHFSRQERYVIRRVDVCSWAAGQNVVAYVQIPSASARPADSTSEDLVGSDFPDWLADIESQHAGQQIDENR